jgi:hypothetical protein
MGSAEEIVFNQATKELIVTGWKNYFFDGAIEIKNTAKMETLRFKVGEKIAYIE